MMCRLPDRYQLFWEYYGAPIDDSMPNMLLLTVATGVLNIDFGFQSSAWWCSIWQPKSHMTHAKGALSANGWSMSWSP